MSDYLAKRDSEEVEKNISDVKDSMLQYVNDNLREIGKLQEFVKAAEARMFDVARVSEMPEAELVRTYRLVSKRINDFIDNVRKILGRDIINADKEVDDLKTILMSLSPSTIQKFKSKLKENKERIIDTQSKVIE